MISSGGGGGGCNVVMIKLLLFNFFWGIYGYGGGGIPRRYMELTLEIEGVANFQY